MSDQPARSDGDALLRDRPLYNFDSVEFVEIKHADWQAILLRARNSLPATNEIAKLIESHAKIAEPWPGFWLDESSTEADRAVVAVRTEIAEKIRATSLAHDAAEGTNEVEGVAKRWTDEHLTEIRYDAPFLEAAPPKPAPDAVRSLIALVLPVMEAAAAGKSVQLAATDVARELRAYSSAPVPPADGASETLAESLLNAQHCIARETSRSIRLEQTIRDSIEALERNSTSAPIVECLKAALSPSATGAAEPVAHRWKPRGSVNWIYDPHPQWFAAHKDEIDHESLYAAPPVRGEWEIDLDILKTILPRYASSKARDIAAQALSDMEDEPHDGGVYALARWFDTVLSLPVPPGAGEREAVIEECAKYLEKLRESVNSNAWSGAYRACANSLRTLSRQPPQSSSDGERR